MKSFALAALAGFATALDVPAFEYFNYLSQFNKSYNTDSEFKMRFERFIKTHTHITEHNEQENNSYTAGHNQFSDWTYAEYKAIMGYKKGENVTRNTTVFAEVNSDGIDWRQLGGVTPVKDQGQCGSCWSFSTTGAMEGAHFIQTGDLLSFSEQQLVDCSTLNLGCNGGNPLWAYRYLKSHYAELESVYPYVSGTTMKAGDCQYDAMSKTAVEVTASASVTDRKSVV